MVTDPLPVISLDKNLAVCLIIAWIVELAFGRPKLSTVLLKMFNRAVKGSVGGISEIAGRLSAHTGKNGSDGAASEKRAGIFLTFYLVSFSFILTAVLLELSRAPHPFLYYFLNTLIFRWLLNSRGAAVKAAAETASADADTSRAVAYLSKNCLDGITAPMFFISAGFFFGIPAAFGVAYKTLSALDAAVGHKNEKYRNLGRAAARLDEAANFIPSRICGLLLPLIAPFCGFGAAGMKRGLKATRNINSARTYSDDCSSPNNALPAAAFAGIMELRLKYDGAGKNADGADNNAASVIDGTFGNNFREPTYEDIKKAIRLMIAASVAAQIIYGCLLYFLSISIL
jgi:adenosylcobinamide-phosphate synthase